LSKPADPRPHAERGQKRSGPAFESPDPVYWTARGYAVVNADMPGTWYSLERHLPRGGETLRLVVQGQDIYRYPRPLIQARHDDLTNRGRHVIHTGGEYDSHLLVPVLTA